MDDGISEYLFAFLFFRRTRTVLLCPLAIPLGIAISGFAGSERRKTESTPCYRLFGHRHSRTGRCGESLYGRIYASGVRVGSQPGGAGRTIQFHPLDISEGAHSDRCH